MSPRETRDAAVALASVLLATLFLFGPWIVGALVGEPRFFEWDVPEQYWPDLVYLCDGLHDATLPLWNPYDRAGYPYYADPQAGLYHPMNWVLCGLGGASPSVFWAELRVVAAFTMTGLFGMLWLRQLRFAWSGVLVGAVLLMAAPFMRHNWELNLTTAFAWTPLMLWAAERTVRCRRPWDGAVLAMAIAGCAWVGSPPALWQASTITALYTMVRALGELRAQHVRQTEEKSMLPALCRTWAVTLLVGMGLMGVVFVPGLTLAEHSVQAGRSYEAIASGALDLSYLNAIIAPRPGNHLYVGWIALALTPFALRSRPAIAAPMAAIGALAIALTLGGDIFRGAYDLVPGVSLFRSPHRYEAWLGPVSALLAAGGLTSLVGRRPPKWSIRAAMALALLGGLLFAADIPWGDGLLGRGPAMLATATAVTLGALYLGTMERAWVGALIGACVLAELSVAMPANRHTRGGPHPGRDTLAQQVMPAATGTETEWRYLDEFAVSCRSGTRLRRREFRGYQDPLLLESFERVMGSLHDAPELAMQYNVRYALQGPHFIHGWNRHFFPLPDALRANPFATPLTDIGSARLTRLEGALPFAYFVPQGATGFARDRASALAATRRLAPAAFAILEGETASPDPEPATLVSARNIVLERDALRFSIDASAPGWVVVNEAWYPGWQASVDGRSVPIRRANGLVRAVPVQPGAHEIAMRFAPADGVWWRRVWLATCTSLVAWALWRRRNHATVRP